MGTSAVGAAQPGFVAGEAPASADTMGLKLALGNANIGFTLGRGIAHYQEKSANADGRAIDLEALPTLFGEVGACEGSIPFLPDAALPPETSIESEMAGADASHRTEAFFPEVPEGPVDAVGGFPGRPRQRQPVLVGVHRDADAGRRHLLGLERPDAW